MLGSLSRPEGCSDYIFLEASLQEALCRYHILAVRLATPESVLIGWLAWRRAKLSREGAVEFAAASAIFFAEAGLLDSVLEAKGERWWASVLLTAFRKQFSEARNHLLSFGVPVDKVHSLVCAQETEERKGDFTPSSLSKNTALSFQVALGAIGLDETVGYHVGAFIYMKDAFLDQLEDARRGHTNPFLAHPSESAAYLLALSSKLLGEIGEEEELFALVLQ